MIRYIGIDKGEIDVVYCPTERILADFMTKPLQVFAYTRTRDVIMGISDLSSLFASTEGVGIRVEHAVTCDEIVRNKMSENANETSKNADRAL